MAVNIKPKDIVSYIFLKFFNDHEEKIFTIDIAEPLLDFFRKVESDSTSSLVDKLPSADSNPKLYSFLKSLLDELGISSSTERTPILVAFISASPFCSNIFSKLLPFILNSKLSTGETIPAIKSKLEKPGDIIPFLQLLFYSIISNKVTFFNQLFMIIQKGSKDAKKTMSNLNEQIKKSQLEAQKSEFTKILQIYLASSSSRITAETRQFDDKQSLLIDISTQIRPLLSGDSL